MFCRVCESVKQKFQCNNCVQDRIAEYSQKHGQLMILGQEIDGKIEKLISEKHVGKKTSSERSKEVSEWLEDLKKQVAADKQRNDALKQKTRARREELQSQTSQLRDKISKIKSLHQNDMKEKRERYKKLADQLLQHRKKLVLELTQLFSLRKLRKDEDQDDYRIVNVTFPSRGDFWNYSHDECNTGTGYIIQISKLAASYLGVRLPFDMEFKGLKSYARASYPDALDTGQMPLHLISSPQTHQGNGDLFLIGFTMLNYNVAYLAYTQGVRLHSKDVANTLKNLHLALTSSSLGRDLHPPLPISSTGFHTSLENSFNLDFVKCVKLLASEWPGSFQAQKRDQTFLDKFAEDALLNRIKGSLLRANSGRSHASSNLYHSIAFETREEGEASSYPPALTVSPLDKQDAIRARSDLLEGEELPLIVDDKEWLVL